MTLKCQCCGFEKDFIDGEAAFVAGWDAPPHFTGYVCCNLCPAVCIVLALPHTKAHALWSKVGRPNDFGPMCLPDESFPKELEQVPENVN